MPPPEIKFISTGEGRGRLFINGMEIPGVDSVVFEISSVRPAVCRVQIAASNVSIIGPAQVAMSIEEKNETETRR